MSKYLRYKPSIVVLILFCFLIVSCDQDLLQTDTAPNSDSEVTVEPLGEVDGPIYTHDDMLAEINEDIPRFGGFYKSENNLHIFIKDLNNEYRKSVNTEHLINEITSGISEVYGSDIVQSLSEEKQASGKVNTELVPAKFSYQELNEWRRTIRTNMVEGDLVFSDLDESANRIALGISEDSDISDIYRKITELGIPEDAVLVERTPPIRVRPQSIEILPPGGGGGGGQQQAQP